MKVIALILILFFLTACIPQNGAECSSDSDCIPASCCHPDSCVPKEKAPECRRVLCSQECQPDTLDCGQGSCKCINNKCQAVFE